jgi:tetratricopeptide (TPR) repeat protein
MMPKNVNPPDPKFPWENGGADNFIRFFAEELIPYVDAHYRTHDYRVLIGHSMGGLFAIYTLTKQPDVFDAYIAISPSLLFDQQSLVEQADKYFRETETLKKTLYMTTGNEGMGVTGGVLKLAGILTEHQPAGFEWDSCIMSEETHISVVHRSTRQGLEFVFKHWAMRNPLEVYDIGGLEGILAFSNKAQNRYGINPNATEQQLNGLIHKLIQDNRLDEARAVIEHDPKEFTPWPWVFLELGQEYKDLGDTDQAIKYLTRANELNPRDKGVQQLLAELGVDPSNFAKVIEVSPEELAIYVGCYGPDSNGGELKVELNEGKLNVTFGEKTEAPFSPGPDRHFYSGSQELVFTTDDGGAVIRVEVLVGGKVVASLPRK